MNFADAYPLLLTSEGSLAALNALIADGPHAAEGPLPMARFRPSLVVAGAPAWAEDGWRRLRIGAATFRAVKGCDRCVLTTVNPDTAAKGKEPIATLARHRRWDGKTWFGMNLIPDIPGAVLSVGDGFRPIRRRWCAASSGAKVSVLSMTSCGLPTVSGVCSVNSSSDDRPDHSLPGRGAGARRPGGGPRRRPDCRFRHPRQPGRPAAGRSPSSRRRHEG